MTRYLREKLSNNIMYSFRVKQTKLPFMESPWHFHSEYELICNDTILEKTAKVFACVSNHFQKDIALSQIVSHAILSKTAFWGCFKSKSTKTFQQYLIEVRINEACELLVEGQLVIAEISLVCGFNSLSYLNKQFKLFKKQTLREYDKHIKN